MFEGAFSLQGTGISGWARQINSNRPLWVEILVDGYSMGSAYATLQEPNNCGFWFALSPAALENAKEVRVRIANTDIFLGDPLLLSENTENICGLQGEVVADRGLTLSGWAIDSINPNKHIQLTVSVDDKKVAEVLACNLRYKTHLGSGHAFTVHLPLHFADGCEHTIAITDSQKRALPGTPFPIRAWIHSIADLIEETKQFDNHERNMIATIVRRMERNMPETCATTETDFAAWKEAFPIPKPQVSLRVTLDLPVSSPKGIANQKNITVQISKAKAQYGLIMQDTDSLHPFALAHMISCLRESGANLIYADSENSDTHEPCFRPAWDEDYFWAYDYLGPFLVSRNVLDATPKRDNESYASYRVRLVQNATMLGKIRHLPLLLSLCKTLPEDAGRTKALQEWICAFDQKALVERLGQIHRIHWSNQEKPFVSIIIPTKDHAKDLECCLISLAKTQYDAYEILIVDNGTTEPHALKVLKDAEQNPKIRILPYPEPFNYADMNTRAVSEAKGTYICFLNNDTEILEPNWLSEMAGTLLAQGEKAGCVGAKLLWPNGLVQHAGVVVGIHRLAGHIGNNWMRDETGYEMYNQVPCQRSAVTAACLLTPKKLFLDLGGFDAQRFAVTFNDVDYCLRVRNAGKKVVVTPYATLLHKESASRGKDVEAMNIARSSREMHLFRQRWGNFEDPFYNPNLPLSTVTDPYVGLAVPPRPRTVR